MAHSFWFKVLLLVIEHEWPRRLIRFVLRQIIGLCRALLPSWWWIDWLTKWPRKVLDQIERFLLWWERQEHQHRTRTPDGRDSRTRRRRDMQTGPAPAGNAPASESTWRTILIGGAALTLVVGFLLWVFRPDIFWALAWVSGGVLLVAALIVFHSQIWGWLTSNNGFGAHVIGSVLVGLTIVYVDNRMLAGAAAFGLTIAVYHLVRQAKSQGGLSVLIDDAIETRFGARFEQWWTQTITETDRLRAQVATLQAERDRLAQETRAAQKLLEHMLSQGDTVDDDPASRRTE